MLRLFRSPWYYSGLLVGGLLFTGLLNAWGPPLPSPWWTWDAASSPVSIAPARASDPPRRPTSKPPCLPLPLRRSVLSPKAI